MIKQKYWHIPTEDEADLQAAQTVAASFGLRLPTAVLLVRRGYRTPEAVRGFLTYESECLHDPFLLTDMEQACETLEAALRDGEKITIYGDYDVDGVTAVSALYLYLTEKRKGRIAYYIPNRNGEGYGMNRAALDKIKQNGTGLVVTVDTGVTAIDEVAYAVELGMKVVVTDHHTCQEELPRACAVVNPHRAGERYPFPELAGVGVAFKLICAMEFRRIRAQGGDPADCLPRMIREYGDLVTLGTVADVMPLVDENRLIVSMGLARLEETCRPGLRALLDQVTKSASKGKEKKKVSSTTVGYLLAPRINAAGRLRGAERAVELFLTQSETEGEIIARELCDLNRERQNRENEIVEEAKRRIEAEVDLTRDRVLVLSDDHWHHGIIGIVASRLTEQYGLPSLLISFEGEEDPDLGKGSGRSVPGLNLVEALRACEDTLVRYGGHELAAGLTIRRENLPLLRERINAYARDLLKDARQSAVLEIDAVLTPEDVLLEQAEELDRLEPFGTANPVPLFVLRDLCLQEKNAIGGGKHTKMTLFGGGRSLSAVLFGYAPEELPVQVGMSVDVVCQLNVNEFMGNRTVQLIVQDIRKSEAQRQAEEAEEERYHAIRSGTELPQREEIPCREDLAGLYRRLKRESGASGTGWTENALWENLREAETPGKPSARRLKLRLMLDILSEVGLLGRTEEGEDGQARLFLPTVEGKVRLEDSPLYKRLRQAALLYERTM